jgi:predicted enzyme related to lactoylglutathione lyase
MSAPFVWFDLTVSDNADEVRQFYAALFDWTTVPATGAAPYEAWLADGDQPWAGVLPAESSTSGRWLPYVVVDDVDVAAKRAESLGATVVKDRTDGPAGTSVTIADPAGALIALFQPSAA